MEIYKLIHRIILKSFKKISFLNKLIPTLPASEILSIKDWLFANQNSKKYTVLNQSYADNKKDIFSNADNYIFKNLERLIYPEIYIAEIGEALVCKKTGFAINSKTKVLFLETNIYGNFYLNYIKFNNSFGLSKIWRINNSRATFIFSGFNYYHWHFEFLYRLIKFKEQFNSSLKIYSNYSDSNAEKWQKEILEIFNIKHSDLEIIPANINYIVIPNFYFISFGGLGAGIPNKSSILFLNNYLKTQFNVKDSELNYKRVYISRKKAKKRKVENEAELEYMLINSFGFKVFNMEDFRVCEQYEIFRNAEVVVAIHGPALTNLIASSKKMKVVELLNEKHIQACYYQIATSLEMEYFAFLCKSVDNISQNSVKDCFVSNNIYVDLEKLNKLLLNILN
ncbi:MAG: glycosyltransferase family 61 protein [Bacteroidota bacterium]|nr:glycosyltransferase family 61 protein [Bacteroidota bacterium]